MSTAEEWIKKDENLAKFAKDFYAIQPGPDPWEKSKNQLSPTTLEPPTEGFIKEPSGWGANQDPKVWNIYIYERQARDVQSSRRPDKNVATDFTTEDNAKYYIEYYQSLEQNPEPEPEPEPGPEPPPVSRP